MNKLMLDEVYGGTVIASKEACCLEPRKLYVSRKETVLEGFLLMKIYIYFKAVL